MWLPHTPRRQVFALQTLLATLLLSAFLVVTQAAQADGPQRYNGTGKEVILQGFHWTAYDPANNGNKRWYRIIAENAAAIKAAGFDYV